MRDMSDVHHLRARVSAETAAELEHLCDEHERLTGTRMSLSQAMAAAVRAWARRQASARGIPAPAPRGERAA